MVKVFCWPIPAPQIATQGVKDLDFGGIRVTIKQGDITTEQVDAIVNSSNQMLDLNRGNILTKTKQFFSIVRTTTLSQDRETRPLAVTRVL